MESHASALGGHDGGTVSAQAFMELVRNFTKLKASVEENYKKDHENAVDLSAGWLVLCGECAQRIFVLWGSMKVVAHHFGAVTQCFFSGAGALAFFMQTGFAMLETGVVSKSNAINVLFKVRNTQKSRLVVEMEVKVPRPSFPALMPAPQMDLRASCRGHVRLSPRTKKSARCEQSGP